MRQTLLLTLLPAWHCTSLSSLNLLPIHAFNRVPRYSTALRSRLRRGVRLRRTLFYRSIPGAIAEPPVMSFVHLLGRNHTVATQPLRAIAAAIGCVKELVNRVAIPAIFRNPNTYRDRELASGLTTKPGAGDR
jgi:hypothetical protein